MKLNRFPETLALVRLGPGTELPAWAESSSVFSVTATATETTVVCAGRSVPKKAVHHKPFTAFVVEGPLDLARAGALVDLLTPLAEEEVGVLTLSAFDAEWVLVPAADADRAAEAWRRRGHEVEPAAPATASGRSSR